MNYSHLINTPTGPRWQKIGIYRRAGVAVPLFSIYSRNSVGFGEISDLKLLVDWCGITGQSIIQLLPINEIGDDRAPYNSISTFAIEPIFINLNNVVDIDLNLFLDEISRLKRRFPQRKLRANYAVKQAKLALLLKMFHTSGLNDARYSSFCNENSYWLDDYALFRIIHEKLDEPKWEKWPDELKNRNLGTLGSFRHDNRDKIEFLKWVQWQLFEQLKEVKKYANSHGVFMMGDLPFLVSRDSADVWTHQNYFSLELSAGAPPDMYFALGQKWGMPPYNWFEIADDKFSYIKNRLIYAGNFYDMYRIDHFVGLFRIWTIPLNLPPEEAAFRGRYEPSEEHLWEEHGKAILNVMLESSSMLPCGEDLGTVPGCSYKTLHEYGIPGIEFQRYLKEPSLGFGFKKPSDYRINSDGVISTHDSSFFFNWWKHEAGTMDEKLFEMLCAKQGLGPEQIRDLKRALFDKKLSGHGRLYWNEEINSRELFLSIVKPNSETGNALSYAYLDSFGEKRKFLEYLEYRDATIEYSGSELVFKCLEKINQSASIFSVQLIQEYLALDDGLYRKMSRWRYRINTPGSVSPDNWSVLLPCSLEELLELDINDTIRELASNSGRA